MVQLVSLNTRKGEKRQNVRNVAIHRGNGKQKKTALRERKAESNGSLFLQKGEKIEAQGKEQNERNPHVHIQHAIQEPHNSAGQQL